MSAGELSALELRRRLASGQSLRQIGIAYSISPTTVLRRKRELGLGGFSAEVFMEHDSPEQIRRCLSCRETRCIGECDSIRRLRS